MKTTCIIFVLFFSINVSFGQSLSVFDVDASNFPTIKAKFYAFDKDRNQLTNLNPSDFELKENGQSRTVTYVSCPPPQPLQLVSIAMSIDVSGSMSSSKFGEIPVELGKTTAKELCNLVPMPPSEFALQTCHHQAFIIQDYTTNKTKILSAIEPIKASGDNNFVEHLLNRLTGLLNIAKIGKNKRVAVIYTDAWWYALTQQELQQCKDTCSKYNITFYAIIYSRQESEPNGIKRSLQELADFTGGYLYDGVTSTTAAKDIGLKLQQTALGGKPCVIEWQSNTSCDASITNVELQITNLSVKATINYQSPNTSIAKLEFNPISVKFPNPYVGVKVEKEVTATARNANFTITNITSNNTAFEITPRSFTLNSGESKELTISYLPADSGFVYAKFDIVSNLCSKKYYASGGFPGIKPKNKTIKLLHPNGGEEFAIGSDTVITWEGIPDSDTVQLEYTIDNGATWKTITDKASGLQYLWKNIPKPRSTLCKVRIKQITKPNGAENVGDLLHTLSGHTQVLRVISWCPDGSRVVTASDDNTAKIWDTETGKLLHTLSGHTYWVYAASWSPNGSRIATASDDGTARIWDAKTGFILHTLRGHNREVLTVSWSPDCSRVSTTSRDNTAKIWDTETGNLIHTLNGHTSWVYAASWSPDGSRVVTVSGDNTTRIWDARTGILQQKLGGHTSGVYDISWNPEGTRFATASIDNTAKIWDTETGDILHTLRGHTAYVMTVRWSPDGSRVTTASYDKTARIWDTETGALLHTLSGHNNNVINVSWSPDGSCIATASDDKTAKIWDAETGKALHTLNGHTREVKVVNWSPDGSIVATASYDSTAKIWYAGGYRELQGDESDNVFSIVAPSVSANDIDIGQCLIGTTKDSVVVGFIQNVGSYKFRVDSIYFQGADADAFSLVSGFPKYVVDANQVYHAEFRFMPNRVGIHTADIVIVTQAETILQNIRGEGVEPRLELVDDLIDFGIVEIKEFKDTLNAVTIKCVGNIPITIKETKHNYPNDIDFTTLSGGGSFTLQPNDTHKMDLRFTASSIGRTSGTLEFHYDGTGSPAVVQLYGQGLGGLIKIDSDSAFAGEKRMLRLRLGNNIKPKSNDLATGFKAVISYNPTLLSCQDVNVTKNYNLLAETVEINGKWNGKSNLLGEFEIIAGLGNADSTNLVLEEFFWLDDNEQPVDYEVEMQNGTFKLLGICYEGGARLINPNNKVELLQISPNPNDGNLAVELNLIEEGFSTLSICNSNGQLMYEQNLSGSTGKIDLNIDTKEYGNGLYFVSLQTPTIRKVKQMVVFK